MTTDKEIAFAAHRHAVRKTTEVLIKELGAYLKEAKADPDVLLELCGSRNSHGGIITTHSGLHIPMYFDVRYDHPMTEKEYREAEARVEKTGPLVAFMSLHKE